MSLIDANAQEDGSFLTECVSDEMSACEAADSTHACWTEAEDALAPVIGREGLAVVFRQGEAVAERCLGENAPTAPDARASIDAFCDWVKSLSTEHALCACKAFLVSVEDYLLSLLGDSTLHRLLRRARGKGPSNFTK